MQPGYIQYLISCCVQWKESSQKFRNPMVITGEDIIPDVPRPPHPPAHRRVPESISNDCCAVAARHQREETGKKRQHRRKITLNKNEIIILISRKKKGRRIGSLFCYGRAHGTKSTKANAIVKWIHHKSNIRKKVWAFGTNNLLKADFFFSWRKKKIRKKKKKNTSSYYSKFSIKLRRPYRKSAWHRKNAF